MGSHCKAGKPVCRCEQPQWLSFFICMETKIISIKPGVLIGLSCEEAYKGKSAYFYDGGSLIYEVDLEHPFPSHQTDVGDEPGIVVDLFYKKSLKVKYPRGAKIEVLTTNGQ